MDKQFLYYSEGEPVEVAPKVFEALVKSDNKIRYFEHDLKVELTVRRNGQAVRLPSREDSLERLMDLHIQFADDSVDVAGEVEHAMMLDKLHRCLALLDAKEQELIQGLYFDGHSERSWSAETGVLQKTINNRKRRALDKLHKLLEFQK